jgi:hypothetical protein
MLAIVGTYSFLGPMAAVAFGGDFNVAFRATSVPPLIADAVSALGLIILSTFMGFMGRELLGWAGAGGSRSKSVLTMTVAPWLFGALLVSLIYWPLPRFIVGSNVVGSVFWLFAVAGATFCKSPPLNENAGSPLTLPDLIVTLLAAGSHGGPLSARFDVRSVSAGPPCGPARLCKHEARRSYALGVGLRLAMLDS